MILFFNKLPRDRVIGVLNQVYLANIFISDPRVGELNHIILKPQI